MTPETRPRPEGAGRARPETQPERAPGAPGSDLEITDNSPAGRQLVESYGEGRFRIAGAVYEGSVLVFPERTLTWGVREVAAVTPESLEAVGAAEPPVEVLLLGCGAGAVLLPAELRRALKGEGVAVEAMATGAACRTFNLLVAENRRVAAALIAVD